MNARTGAAWVITFSNILRARLPNHIISHAPQAPYFHSTLYGTESYLKVHSQAGSGIDFYNIQFYNQGANEYITYQTIFVASANWFPGTSVSEMIANGIPSEKIVVGKPSAPDQATNGYVDPATLGTFVSQAYSQLGWNTGVMFWQYNKDLDGAKMALAVAALMGYPTEPVSI